MDPYDFEYKLHECPAEGYISQIWDFPITSRDPANDLRENAAVDLSKLVERSYSDGLRWILLQKNSRSTFKNSKYLVDTSQTCFENLVDGLFLSSPYRFGIMRYSQDFAENACISMRPKKDENEADPCIAVYLPFFKWEPTALGFGNTPSLRDWAQPSITDGSNRSSIAPLFPIAVHQLWLFMTGSKTVISFFPNEQDVVHSEFELSLKDVIIDELAKFTEKGHKFGLIGNAYVMSALIIRATSLLQLSGSKVKTRMTSYLEQRVASLSSKRREAYAMFSNNLDSTIQTSHQSFRGRSGDTELLLEAMSMLEELESFVVVMENQVSVLQQVHNILEKNATRDPESNVELSALENAFNILKTTSEDLNQIRCIVSRYVQNVRHEQNAILQLLDLKQKEANLLEAQYARIRAEQATQQGRAILVFTVFTVIFLPLSFFTSYFGMNVEEITGNNLNTSQALFWEVSGPLTTVIVLFAITTAFYRNLSHFWYKALANFRSSAVRQEP